MSNICPACERGTLSARRGDDVFTFDGEQLVARNNEFSLCDFCEEEIVTEEQGRRNECRFADVKRAHMGLLSSSEIMRIREELGITQREASEVFGGGANAFSKYERGEVLQSRAMDLLLRLARDCPEARRELSQRSGIELGKEWVDIFKTPAPGAMVYLLDVARASRQGLAVHDHKVTHVPNDRAWMDQPDVEWMAHGCR